MIFSFIQIFLLSVGVAMDAFAVSIERGISVFKIQIKQALLIALLFGLFQSLMPLLGIQLAKTFQGYVESYDHWIAFGLLVLIGGKMIRESFETKEESQQDNDLRIGHLLILALAISIDSLAVGISLVYLKLPLGLTVVCMGLVTFALSLTGVLIGKKLTSNLGHKAELVGGLVLIGIGIKILVEHIWF
ncbi:MAG: manganese efflux pump MntP family protein [Candidatus Caenarcaniphilales bacterium]|nr:manganese efflux pump MntP family protein [Candidatus Caenarcaniphilales bacterium]